MRLLRFLRMRLGPVLDPGPGSRGTLATVSMLAVSLLALPPLLSAADFGAAEPGRAWLGFAVDDSLVPGRVVVVEVEPTGPAQAGGVRLQDMILAVNGTATADADQFAAAVAAIAPGDEVRLAVGRAGGTEEVRIKAVASAAAPASVAAPPPADTAAVPPATSGFEPKAFNPPSSFSSDDRFAGPAPNPAAAESPWRKANEEASPPSVKTPSEVPPGNLAKPVLGVRTVPVDPSVQSRYSLPDTSGALVVAVVDDMPASRAGLPTGSVIVAFDRRPVRTPRELTQLVAEVPVEKPVRLQYILPGGESREAEVSLVSAAAAPSVATAAPEADTTATEIRRLRAALEDISRRLDAIERRRVPE